MRVFPMPPGPMRVTRRAPRSKRAARSESSVARPTNEDATSRTFVLDGSGFAGLLIRERDHSSLRAHSAGRDAIGPAGVAQSRRADLLRRFKFSRARGVRHGHRETETTMNHFVPGPLAFAIALTVGCG